MVEIPSIFSRAVEILSKPFPDTWDRLYTAPTDKREALIELGAALGVSVVLFVLAGIIYGILGLFLVAGVLQAAAVIGMVFGMAALTDLLAPYFKAMKAGEQGVKLFSYASIPVAAVLALGALLLLLKVGIGRYFLVLGVGYGAYHFYLAAPTYYGVPDAKRLPFTGAVYGIWLVGLYTAFEVAFRIAL